MPEGELRGEVIRLHHDTLVGGHGGRWKMTELVTCQRRDRIGVKLP